MRNTTHHTIKYLLGLAAASLVASCLVACAPAGSQRIAELKQAALDETHRAGLGRLEQAYATARYHQGRVVEAALLLASAKHNVDAVAYAGELAARIGFHTEVLMKVAASAATARRELPEFRVLVELAVRKLSDSQAVIDLAALAAAADSEPALAALDAQLRSLDASAECKSVEEAVVRVEAMQKNLEAAAR